MTTDADDLLELFWRNLAEVRTGMLGLAGEDGRTQPMTAHFDRAGGPIWFYARADSHLSEALGDGGAAPGVFHYASGGHDLYACVNGDLVPETDASAAERFWSEEVARWFPQGPDDPEVRLLRFDPAEARLWRPTDGPDFKTFGLRGEAPIDVRAQVRL